MLDISRNIVVTAENIEEVLVDLYWQDWRAQLSLAIVHYSHWIYRDEREMTVEERIHYNQRRSFKIKNLIDRIELVRHDLHGSPDSRFHTIPQDVLRCRDCVAFGYRTVWNDKHGYWILSEQDNPIQVRLRERT